MLGAHELGLYSAATKTFFMVLTFVWIYAYALFPKLSAASENAKEVCRLLRRHTLFLGAAGTLSVGVLSFLAEPIIRLFFSEKFLVILPVFKALNFFLILVFFNILYADSLNAFDKQRSRLVIVMRGLALNVVLNGILIPSLGLMGAVYASAMAQLLILIMSYGQVKKLYQPRVGLFILAFLLLNLAVIQWSLS